MPGEKRAMKTVEFQGLKIRLDRPKGFVQEGKDKEGKPWRRVYQYDYGYLPKTKGGDGDGVDVFIGPDAQEPEAYWVIQRDDAGKFDEYKVFLGFPDRAAVRKAYGAHIPMKYFGSMVAMPIEMMKAMLGIEPADKLAQRLSFLSELERIQAALSG